MTYRCSLVLLGLAPAFSTACVAEDPPNADAAAAFVDCMEDRGLEAVNVTISKSEFDYELANGDEFSTDEIVDALKVCEPVAQAVLDGSGGYPFGDYEPQRYEVPMRDGVHLATDVYLPEGTGPFAAVLYRTPYEQQRDLPPQAADFLGEGIAVITQDLRGRGDSEGDDPVFRTEGAGELRDGADTVDWIVAQEFSSGRVAALGTSASGIAAYLQLTAAPEGLVAARVDAATANLFDTLRGGGVFRESLAVQWLEEQGSSDFLDEIYAHPYLDEFWEPLQARVDYGRVEVPVLHVAGWYDVFCQDTLDAFVGFQTQGGAGARGTQKLVIGPWVHGDWYESREVGELSYPEAALTPPVSPEQLQRELFTATLSGSALDDWEQQPVVQYFVMGDPEAEDAPGNEWRTADAWPPAYERQRLYLHEAEVISAECPEAGSDSYAFELTHPAPTVCGANLNIDTGPCDQRSVEQRDDTRVYSTPTFDEPFEVTGQASATFFVELDRPDADLVVRLSDVYPDGRSMLVTEGAARVAARGSNTELTPASEGEVVEVHVELASTSIVFDRGHRLRISVGSSSSPRYRVNRGSGEPFGADPGEAASVEVTLHRSAEYPSYLELPTPRAQSSDCS